MTIAHDLVARARAARSAVPPEVEAAARLHLLDALCVGLAGAARGPLRGLADRLVRSAPGDATVLGTTSTAAPSMAALLNGAAIHSLEYDDTHVASVMHGSSLLAPAALAAARQHGAGGHDLMRAYVVGYEVLIRLGLASPGRLQARGFQTTSAAGPFAAALVSALLEPDPDDDRAVAALGIAGMQPGGTFGFLEHGDTVKAVQPGWAAHAGLVAADLARAGVTGPDSVLEGRYGFFALFADDPDAPDRLRSLVATLGQEWLLPEAAFKLIPCCHFIHPYVEAMLDLVGDGLRPEDVVAVRCHVPDGAAPVIAEPWARRQHPAKPHDARWSLPYVLAGVLVDGEVTLDLFEQPIGGERLRLASVMERVAWPDSGFPARFPARLEVDTRDGQTWHAEVDDVRGGPSRPCTAEEVVTKARANLALAGRSEAFADRLVTEVLKAAEPDLDGALRAIGESSC